MDTSNKALMVFFVISVVAVGSFLFYAHGVTGLATAEVDSGFDYWPLIAGMSGILGIGVLALMGQRQ